VEGKGRGVRLLIRECPQQQCLARFHPEIDGRPVAVVVADERRACLPGRRVHPEGGASRNREVHPAIAWRASDMIQEVDAVLPDTAAREERSGIADAFATATGPRQKGFDVRSGVDVRQAAQVGERGGQAGAARIMVGQAGNIGGQVADQQDRYTRASKVAQTLGGFRRHEAAACHDDSAVGRASTCLHHSLFRRQGMGELAVGDVVELPAAFPEKRLR
jgi:hypothetical protein